MRESLCEQIPERVKHLNVIKKIAGDKDIIVCHNGVNLSDCR